MVFVGQPLLAVLWDFAKPEEGNQPLAGARDKEWVSYKIELPH